MLLSSKSNEDICGGENLSGIERVAHFFLSSPKKEFLEEPIKGSTEKTSPSLSFLAGKERLGLVWMNAGENHLVLSSAFAQCLNARLAGKGRIRIVSFKTPYMSWEKLHSYFPSLPRFLPLDDSSGSVCFSLSPRIEFVHISEGGDAGNWEGYQKGVIYLVSLSGLEEFLDIAFFQRLHEIIFITPPDQASLTQLYQALKWISLRAHWLLTGVLLDGTAFTHLEAWDLFREYEGVVKRFLGRGLNFYGLCDSGGILKEVLSTEALEKNICLF